MLTLPLKNFLVLFLFFLLFCQPNIALSANNNTTISLHLDNADLKTTLNAIAKFSNLNLILDNSITGQISLQLENITAEEALALICSATGHHWQHTSQGFIISKNNNFSNSLANITIIKLKYLDAKNCHNIIKPLINEGCLSVDLNNNCLIFSGSELAQKNLKQLLSQLDIPSKQISLEAKIVAVNKEKNRNIGLSWLWSGLPASKTTQANDNSANLSLPGTIKLSANQSFNYQAFLDAQINSGQAKLLANPKITTLPGYEAKIFIGDHIPVVTEKNNNGVLTQSTEYIDAGIKLTYTAYLNEADYITTTVHTEVSTPTLIATLKNYKISTRKTNTTVRLKNGETLIIAGLIGEDELKRLTEIPFLSNLPLLGNFFKHQETHKQTTEVIIFLTPKIID